MGCCFVDSFNSIDRKIRRSLKWKAIFDNIMYKQFNSPNQEDIAIASLNDEFSNSTTKSSIHEKCDSRSFSPKILKEHNQYREEKLEKRTSTHLDLEYQHYAKILESRTVGANYIKKLNNRETSNKSGKIQKSKGKSIDIIADFLKNKEDSDNNMSICINRTGTPKKLRAIANLEKSVPKGVKESIVPTKTNTNSFDRNSVLPLYKNKRIETILEKLLRKIPFAENSLLCVNDGNEICLSRTDQRLIQIYSSRICGMDNYKVLRIVNYIEKNNPDLRECILGMMVLDTLESVEQCCIDKYSRLTACITKETLKIAKVMTINQFETYKDYIFWLSEQYGI